MCDIFYIHSVLTLIRFLEAFGVINYSTVGLCQSGVLCNEPLRTWINSTLHEPLFFIFLDFSGPSRRIRLTFLFAIPGIHLCTESEI